MRNPHFFILLSSLFTIIIIGTVFYHYVEGWSWVDAYFFTVVTLSTVGYGSIVPVTVIGKIATTILIFSGLGIFALTIQSFATFTINRRVERAKRRLRAEKKRLDQQGSLTD